MTEINLTIPTNIGEPVHCITEEGNILRNEAGVITEMIYNVRTEEYTVTVLLDSGMAFCGKLNQNVFIYSNEASKAIKERQNHNAYAKMR